MVMVIIWGLLWYGWLSGLAHDLVELVQGDVDLADAGGGDGQEFEQEFDGESVVAVGGGDLADGLVGGCVSFDGGVQVVVELVSSDL